MPVEGPLPPDTLFYLAVRKKKYDAIVCMYHDQGHIPLKLLDFEGGVNVTLGLPIIRTSVDHGTAFDIAGRGRRLHRQLYLRSRFRRAHGSWAVNSPLPGLSNTKPYQVALRLVAHDLLLRLPIPPIGRFRSSCPPAPLLPSGP